MKLNLITKKNFLKSIFALRATFTCSRATKFSFAGHIPFKKITCSRAADFPFTGRNWPAGRSLPTPGLDPRLDQRPVILVEHVSWKAFNVKTMVHGRNYMVVKTAVKNCMSALALK